MKASSAASFGINQKYDRIKNLILAYVWYVENPELTAVFALTYRQAISVARKMKYTDSPSWKRGNYVNTKPGVELRGHLEKYRMSFDKWRLLIIPQTRAVSATKPGNLLR